MATAAIFLLEKDNPSNTGTSIVDTDTVINALWTTASTLVGGFMDFTSYKSGLYARYAQGYTAPQLNAAGNFTGRGTLNGAQTFPNVGVATVGQVGASLPVDGNTADLGTIETRVNEIREAVLNLANAQPA